MTRGRRRLLIGTALVVVIALLVTAGWVHFFVFGKLDTALQRAETFEFRRMKVAELAEQGTYRFFFATNRR